MSFWTFGLDRPNDEGGSERFRQLRQQILANQPDESAREYTEISIIVRTKAGVAYAEDPIRVDSPDKLHFVNHLARHAVSRYPTVVVLTSSGDVYRLSTIRSGEVSAIEATARVVRLNADEARRAQGFHPQP